jgi:hypothetical protein
VTKKMRYKGCWMLGRLWVLEMHKGSI